MFRPVQTVGDQLNRCRINYMEHALKVSRQGTVLPALNPEVRTDLIQMVKNFPEQFLRHTCVAVPVRMGQTIPARRNAIANFTDQPAMIPKRIANVVQPERMRQLPENQRKDVACRTEYTRLPVIDSAIK